MGVFAASTENCGTPQRRSPEAAATAAAARIKTSPAFFFMMDVLPFRIS
jgi:hypothetical protein